MTALAASVLVAALLGSVHCAAMCGSFACLAAGGTAWRGTLGYNVGRLLAYGALGAAAGGAGAGLDQAGAVAGVARPATLVAGTLLVLWGLVSLAAALGVRTPALAPPPALTRALGRGMRRVQGWPSLARGLALGLLTAALPCGWLYAFVATAAAAGGAIAGAAVMGAFWVGTVPMLAAVAFGAQRLLGPARRHLPAFTAIVLVVLGGLTVAGRFVPAASPATPLTAHAGHAHR